MSADLLVRLERLSRAVWNGASNPGLIRRADVLADEIAPQSGDLADRLRNALRRKGESLGARFERLETIRRELAHLHQRERADEVMCGTCRRSWCGTCDPAPSALCHWCNGRGYSTAAINSAGAR